MSGVSDASSLPGATLDELAPLVLDELRQLARRQLARERQVLVDAARDRSAMKRGAGTVPLILDADRAAADTCGAELLEFDEGCELAV
jgi:hypothetical protein